MVINFAAKDAANGIVDKFAGTVHLLDSGDKGVTVGTGIRHFHVETGIGGFGTIIDTVKEIGDDEAAKAPFVLEDFAKQVGVFSRVVAANAIVGGHHRGYAGIDDALEVGEIDLAECTLVQIDIELGAVHFDGVQGKVLGARHDIVTLHTFEGGHGHLAE